MENLKPKVRDYGNIYRFIHKEKQCSRQQISDHLELSLPTVTQSLNLLKEDNLIYISGTCKSSGGRKANMFSCVPNARYAVGIDITRNHLSMVLIDLNLEIIAKKRMRLAFEDTTGYYENLCNELELFLDTQNLDRKKLLGVGISLPVIIESDNMTISYASVIHISGNVYQHLKSRMKYPFLFFNDASSAGIAESSFYHTDLPSVYLFLSGSVGGAFLNSGKLFPGRNNRASEFGHMCIVPNGRQCYCGRYGCLDAYCSSKEFTAFTNGNLEQFFVELNAGNKGYRRVFNEYIKHLALAINNLRMCYDCDIILGGTIGVYLNEYLKEIRQTALALNPFETNGNYIQSCHYQTEAAAVGAAIHYVNEFIQNM
ncbi:MAG: ROK family transcriptional regulator [Lachnoclostridium sp.]|nr:ROK family transcriptional regulator [Lachnoclostridium sp.]